MFVQHCGFRHHGGLKTLNPVHCHERFSMFSTPKPPLHPRHWSLSPGELLTLTPTQPTSLHLKSGALWVTQTGDDRDHFLRAGQSMLLAPHRVTVMQAEGVSVRGSLAPADKHSPKWRLGSGEPNFFGVMLQKPSACKWFCLKGCTTELEITRKPTVPRPFQV
jgi:hypothetical protein